MHHIVLIFVWLIAVPIGLFLIAFLAALADCTYSYLFPSPVPATFDDLI
jgi:hypothetical protein